MHSRPQDTIFFGPAFVSIWTVLNMLVYAWSTVPIYTLNASAYQRRVFWASSFRLLQEEELQSKQHWTTVKARAPVKQGQKAYGDTHCPPKGQPKRFRSQKHKGKENVPENMKEKGIDASHVRTLSEEEVVPEGVDDPAEER